MSFSSLSVQKKMVHLGMKSKVAPAECTERAIVFPCSNKYLKMKPVYAVRQLRKAQLSSTQSRSRVYVEGQNAALVQGRTAALDSIHPGAKCRAGGSRLLAPNPLAGVLRGLVCWVVPRRPRKLHQSGILISEISPILFLWRPVDEVVPVVEDFQLLA